VFSLRQSAGEEPRGAYFLELADADALHYFEAWLSPSVRRFAQCALTRYCMESRLRMRSKRERIAPEARDGGPVRAAAWDDTAIVLTWYLVHTKPSVEASAEANLVRQGYGVYFPRLLQTVRSERKLRQRIVALFPRYLFLHLDEGRQSLAPVHSTVGVSGLVRFGSRYAPVPDEVVRQLQAQADPASGLHRKRHLKPARGSVVRMATGPFEGLDAVFEREIGSERVIVLLKVLGRETAVRVPREYVLPSMTVSRSANAQ
jgi:transcriptional antiterminator RfaH